MLLVEAECVMGMGILQMGIEDLGERIVAEYRLDRFASESSALPLVLSKRQVSIQTQGWHVWSEDAVLPFTE